MSRTDPLHQTSRVWRLYINVVDTPSRLQYQTVVLAFDSGGVASKSGFNVDELHNHHNHIGLYYNCIHVISSHDVSRGVLYFNGPLITQTTSGSSVSSIHQRLRPRLHSDISPIPHLILQVWGGQKVRNLASIFDTICLCDALFEISNIWNVKRALTAPMIGRCPPYI